MLEESMFIESESNQSQQTYKNLKNNIKENQNIKLKKWVYSLILHRSRDFISKEETEKLLPTYMGKYISFALNLYK